MFNHRPLLVVCLSVLSIALGSEEDCQVAPKK